MKLKFSCRQCLAKKKQCFPEYTDVEAMELGDSYCYDYICPNGHKTKYVIDNPRYEVLYDFGVSAYLDGYYREAVLDFAAALERFYEYAVFMILGMGVDEKIKKFWNQVKKQSERQIGAYMALHLVKYGECPALPSNAQIEFRNNVTHKGYFPTEKESREYGEFVANYILSISYKFPDDFRSRVNAMYPALDEVMNKDGYRMNHTINTVIGRLRQGIEYEDAIKQFQEDFELYYGK